MAVADSRPDLGSTRMATHASAFTPDRSRTLRRCAWALAWLALAVLSIDFLVGVHAKYHAVTAEAYAMFWSRRAWLWTHLAGGALTIVLGPLQFLPERVDLRPDRRGGRVGRRGNGGIRPGRIAVFDNAANGSQNLFHRRLALSARIV